MNLPPAAHNRYLYLVEQYHPVVGGAERYCADLAETFVQRGNDPEVYASRLESRYEWRNTLPGFEIINRVRVHRFRALHRGWLTWRIFHLCQRRYANRPALAYEMGLMLAAGPVCLGIMPYFLANSARFGVAHLVGLYGAMTWQMSTLIRLMQLPFVVTPFVHVGSADNTTRMIWQRQVLMAADRIIAVTNQEKEFITREMKLNPAKVAVINLGVRVADFPQMSQQQCRQQFTIPDDAFAVLFLGRKEEYKGLKWLLNAWRTIRNQGRSSLYLILAGPDTEYSEKLLRQEAPSDGLINLGAVVGMSKTCLLNACDCLVLPSKGESFGIVILEAWAVSKPVIASRLESISEIVTDGKDGLLVKRDSSDELIQALIQLIDSPSSAQSMGAAGYQKVLDKYTVERMAENTVEIYSSILPERR